MPTEPRTHGVASPCAKPAISGYLDISRRVFWYAHPTTIRMLLGLSSLLFAVIMLVNPAVAEMRQYTLMMAVMPGWLWVVGMLLHFVGVFWRIFDATPRVRWALAINLLGCYLWFTLTICVNVSMGGIIPGSSLEVITCLFAAWALIRTGIGKDVGTP